MQPAVLGVGPSYAPSPPGDADAKLANRGVRRTACGAGNPGCARAPVAGGTAALTAVTVTHRSTLCFRRLKSCEDSRLFEV